MIYKLFIFKFMRKFFKKFAGYKTEINDEEEKNEQEEAEEDEYYEEDKGGAEEEEDEENDDEQEENEHAGEAEEESGEAEQDDYAKEAEISSDEEESKEWLGGEYEEGQLSIDVYQTPENIVVKSTIAGVKPDDIDISINNDLLTIRGKREMPEKIKQENYLFRECYWGPFSRSVILPVEIIPEKIDASLENGVLTVILPKAKASKQISIKVKSK